MHIQELAKRLDAVVPDGLDVEITGVATIEDAESGQVTFLANPRYERSLAHSAAAAVFVDAAFDGESAPALLRVENPYLAFARAIDLFYVPPRPPTGVHPTAVIGRDAVLGSDVAIDAYAVIGDHVRIGDGTVIHPHVVVYDGAVVGEHCVLHSHSVVREHVCLGDRVILQNSAVIGADGFGFAPRGDGAYEKITQAGHVVLADDVEVQACACVDRATVGATTVARGTKIDNLTQIGHGCHVGEDTLLCGQVGLAGSTEVGDRVVMAGQVGVGGHCRIGDDVVLAGQAGAANSIEEPGIYGGYPAIPMRTWRECLVHYKKLPKTARHLKDIECRVARLESAQAE